MNFLIKGIKTRNFVQNIAVGCLVIIIPVLFVSCSSSNNQHPLYSQHNAVAIYKIQCSVNPQKFSITSIDVTPPLSGQNITGKAGIFQIGNAVFNGSMVTAPVYLTNNDSVPWTGVEMQAYTVISGNPIVANPDLGTGWYTNSPVNGAWGWLFTSGTAGAAYTIPAGGQSVNKVIGFYATSDFVALVYIYANVPVISSLNPAFGFRGSTVTISGYNFSTTHGSVTFNGTPATVQSWTDNSIVVTVPPNATSGNVVVNTTDTNTPYSNPVMFTVINNISGTITYSGTKTGWVYIDVQNAGGGNTMYGTSISSSSSGAFTIHGVPSGTYVLNAWLDNVGTGTLHASNPTGTSTAFSITSTDVTGISVSVSDPSSLPSLTAPGLTVYGGDGTVVVGIGSLYDSNGAEIPEAYDVYWSTSNAPCSTAGGGVTTVVANNMGVFLQGGLTNGTTYYYSVAGVLSGNVGPCSSAYAVTPTTSASNYTVSGTISSNVTPTGPLYVAIFLQGGHHGMPTFYGLTSIASPSASQAYSISGIPNGTYSMIVIQDMNNDNTIDVGDITSGINGNGTAITVNNGNVVQDISLNGVDASAIVTTQHYTSTTSTGYNLNTEIDGEMKLPVSIELISGPNIVVPVDLGNSGTTGGTGYYQAWFNNIANRPTVGDTYSFTVTYADTTTGTLTASVTGVLDSFPTPIYPTAANDGNGDLTPTFQWNAPSNPPNPYQYYLWIQPNNGGNDIWNIYLSSGVTSTTYNSDGSASQSSLSSGTAYNWSIGAVDSYGNQAQYQTQWTP